MAYYPDLSKYVYIPSRAGADVRQQNVGWLAADQEFMRRKSPDALLDRVWGYTALSFMETRGRHLCEFCGAQESRTSERNGEQLRLGSAELRVLSPTGEIFAAPNLIYHYMAVHDYSPPEPFIDAVMNGPQLSSAEYLSRLAAVGLVPKPTLRPRPEQAPT